jgi:hypothetical protein
MPFGVVSTDTESAYKSLNSRRKIFYQFPTGAMPIMGILSLLYRAKKRTNRNSVGGREGSQRSGRQRWRVAPLRSSMGMEVRLLIPAR